MVWVFCTIIAFSSTPSKTTSITITFTLCLSRPSLLFPLMFIQFLEINNNSWQPYTIDYSCKRLKTIQICLCSFEGQITSIKVLERQNSFQKYPQGFHFVLFCFVYSVVGLFLSLIFLTEMTNCILWLVAFYKHHDKFCCCYLFYHTPYRYFLCFVS